jgi:2-dehydro-3-deoxyphosphogluconate aldolase / (4S)-4-hydroxy-2-oxoglutarate aldolase
MTTKQRILNDKLIGIIRLSDDGAVPDVVDAMMSGGISLIEITLTTPNAFEHIVNTKERYPMVCVGAGTVFGDENARNSIEAGAEFLVSPVSEVDVIEVAGENDVVCIAGSLTPNEIYEAHLHGVDFIKPFPMTGLGLAPMPFLSLIPSNGVTIDTIKDYFNAGVKAVGLGSPLVTDADVRGKGLQEVEERVKIAVSMIRSL